jgi:6-phosphogluconolactonase
VSAPAPQGFLDMGASLVVVDEVETEFSDRVIEAFHNRPGETFSMALSGGDTARSCYQRLADDAETQIDWWKVDLYWGDERCVPADDPASNYHLAREALLDRVGAANATYPMRCDEGPDPYQLRVGELGRFDLVHLGLGPDGHTASLFPDSPALDADPGRLVTMNDDPTGRNPHRRMTLTYAGIARARLVLVTVVGEAKREALQRVAAGDPTAPASAVRAERVVFLADHAAAGDLDGEG